MVGSCACARLPRQYSCPCLHDSSVVCTRALRQTHGRARVHTSEESHTSTLVDLQTPVVPFKRVREVDPVISETLCARASNATPVSASSDDTICASSMSCNVLSSHASWYTCSEGGMKNVMCVSLTTQIFHQSAFCRSGVVVLAAAADALVELLTAAKIDPDLIATFVTI